MKTASQQLKHYDEGNIFLCQSIISILSHLHILLTLEILHWTVDGRVKMTFKFHILFNWYVDMSMPHFEKSLCPSMVYPTFQ